MLILYNGRIQTLDPDLPQATALAIEGDRIVAVGSDEEVLVLANWRSTQQDLNGKTIWIIIREGYLILIVRPIHVRNACNGWRKKSARFRCVNGSAVMVGIKIIGWKALAITPTWMPSLHRTRFI
jgi:hypothetical protein